MTHSDEKEFSLLVEEKLIEQYGEDKVEKEVYLPQTGRFADFVVRGPITNFAIEAKDNWEGCFKGVGQAELYAEHIPNCIPVIAIPKGHTESPETEMLRNSIAIWEVEK